MDELIRRLREDAKEIDARITPELDRRLRAALDATSPAVVRPRGLRWPMLVAAAAGIAAAAMVAVAVLKTETVAPPRAEPRELMISTLTPDAAAEDLLDPLSEEYESIQADFIKVRRKLSTRISF